MLRSLALISAALLLTTSVGCSPKAKGTVVPEQGAPEITYTLPQLPYAYAALEPAIDAQTMTIHHTKHHQAYVDNLNKALKGTPGQRVPLERLLGSISAYPPAVRNNAGGHWNHSFFWSVMTTSKSSGAPSPKLLAAINSTYGSLENFKMKFNDNAMGRFGSGWAWLVKTPAGLVIFSTPNQDNPLMDVADLRGTPLLAVDVWEHAYYLRYQNKRADYLKNWWSVVNWAEVSRIFEAS